ncbi:hypothetical protein [Devosia sp. MC1541]|uniref:hypothetical protein n=1 Tax=Devosia sp. MC1541 TaxID=2725264 RepID=UPI00145D46B0|nr:hypothetical protein [Devosia sp. MC1541]
MSSDIITTLKYLAHRRRRAKGLSHTDSLDQVAVELGQPHWRELAEAHKRGWTPDPAKVAQLEAGTIHETLATRADYTALAQDALGDGLTFTRWEPEDVSPMEADQIFGHLDGVEFYIAGDEFEVALGVQGWEILLDQPPKAKPQLKRLGGRVKSVDALDPAFVERATKLLRIRARRMHAEVAADWPVASTLPDEEGRALHPLSDVLSAEWYCLHCDGKHDGHAMSRNLWHCPDCGATPIDMFPEPFWNGDQTPPLIVHAGPRLWCGPVFASAFRVPRLRCLLMPRSAKARALQGVCLGLRLRRPPSLWVGFRFR